VSATGYLSESFHLDTDSMSDAIWQLVFSDSAFHGLIVYSS